MQIELQEIKAEINCKKEKLNYLIAQNPDSDNIIRLSKELDVLINKYHLLELKENIKNKEI